MWLFARDLEPMLCRATRSLLVSFVVLVSFGLVHSQSEQTLPRLRPIQQDGKWGYIDSVGRVVIKPQFEWAEEFSEGLAAFQNKDGKHGYVDQTGKIVIEAKFDNWTEF